MKIQTRIILAFAFAVVIGFACIVQWLGNDIKPHYRESAEETLVDTAEILAALAAPHFSPPGFDVGPFRDAFSTIGKRTLDAQVYQLRKTAVLTRLYITDATGRVVFDSDDGRDEGKDYSQWNDVYRTLRGQYGARSSRADPADPYSTVMHVAAPVVLNGEIVGSLTVAKPNESAQALIEAARRRLLNATLLAALLTVLFGLAASWWIGHPIQLLIRYARDIKQGKRVALPKLGGGEIAALGEALEEMRKALDGRDYTKQYVQALTHELKSPLSAIAGASEILGEDLAPRERSRFVDNIQRETKRIVSTVDRLLELAAVEGARLPPVATTVDLSSLLARVREQHLARAAVKEVALEVQVESSLACTGDQSLLEKALGNLVENAISFSPRCSTVVLRLFCEKGMAVVEVIDSGSGIPEYAVSRTFERFYSLPRPGATEKSTGLGLCFVREVAELHGGVATLANRAGGSSGASARLELPLARPLR